MHIDIEALTESELKSQLDQYMRFFDVAHGTLLRLSAAHLDAETMRTQIADALKVIGRYPDSPAFKSA
jgi:hypothetical protein